MVFAPDMLLPADEAGLTSLLRTILGRLVALEQENSALRAENAALREELSVLKARNQRLETENTDLRRRLGLTSKNSHKPPSSDGLQKKPAFPRPKGEKKPGGQPGHPGHTLTLVATPDAVLVHRPLACACCGKSLAEAPLECTLGERQVFDLPAPQLLVTAHRLGVVRCCGVAQAGQFPAQVAAPVQYGPRMQAFTTLLQVDYRLPYQKISTLVFDLFGYRLNESTIHRTNQAVATALVPVEATIQSAIIASPVVHFDETGMRVAGKLAWFHTASTAQWTYLFCHPNRGQAALRSAASVLPEFGHWAIHDCFASYFTFTNCAHGLCGAHLLRELTACEERGSQWAMEMKHLLLTLLKKTQQGIDLRPERAHWEALYQQIAAKADAEEPLPTPVAGPHQRGRKAKSKGRNLLERLLKHQASVLAFAFTPGVPFTNNQAERDIRCVKIKQKVAMSFRTLEGANVYARIQGFVSSVRKNGLNVLQQLLRVIQGETLEWVGT
jgi:transposase